MHAAPILCGGRRQFTVWPGDDIMQATFSILPVEVFLDKRLTLEQVRVLGALFSFRGKDTNVVWPSRRQIAERCGMHLSNISTATSALEKLGWLTKDGKGGHSKATRYAITVPTTVADSATVSKPENSSPIGNGSLIGNGCPTGNDNGSLFGYTLPVAYSATRKEVNQEHNQGTDHTREQARTASPADSKTKKTETTLAKFLEACKENGEQAIPENDPVFCYAAKVGISDEMVEIAWGAFLSYWRDGEAKQKRKKDWRGTFLNAIKQNRSRLWYLTEGEPAKWTTQGQQARRAAA
jgi:hypothetical protein